MQSEILSCLFPDWSDCKSVLRQIWFLSPTSACSDRVACSTKHAVSRLDAAPPLCFQKHLMIHYVPCTHLFINPHCALHRLPFLNLGWLNTAISIWIRLCLGSGFKVSMPVLMFPWNFYAVCFGQATLCWLSVQLETLFSLFLPLYFFGGSFACIFVSLNIVLPFISTDAVPLSFVLIKSVCVLDSLTSSGFSSF